MPDDFINTKEAYMRKKKSNRGRKAIPANEKVVPVTFYVHPSVLKAVGGLDEAREECKDFLIGLADAYGKF